MPRQVFHHACHVSLVAICLLVASAVQGQPPVKELALPPNIQVAELKSQAQPPKPSQEAATREQIRRVLHEGAPATAADPLLVDVLSVLKSRGSVLDGSVLDEKTQADRDQITTHSVINNPAQIAENERALRQLKATEALLRAARLLERVGETTSEQAKLIKQMRAQSTRLLQSLTAKPANTQPN